MDIPQADINEQDDTVFYKMHDLQRILGIGRTLAYQLVQLPSFPKMRINGRYYILKADLQKWIKRNLYKDIQC